MVRVLVVDDDPLELELLSEMLIRLGHDAVAVESVPRARARLRRKHFDLVITDLTMPGGGGLDLLAAMRAWRIDTPFVAVVSEPPDAEPQRAATGPARRDAVILRKPIESGDLAEVLSDLGIRGRKS